MHASRIKIDAVTLYRAFFPRADFATGKMKERGGEGEIFIGALCAANIHTQRSRKGGSMLTIEKGECWREVIFIVGRGSKWKIYIYIYGGWKRCKLNP